MIPINTLLGVLACLACLLAGISFFLLLKARDLFDRAMMIFVCVYDWLEQHKQEADDGDAD